MYVRKPNQLRTMAKDCNVLMMHYSDNDQFKYLTAPYSLHLFWPFQLIVIIYVLFPTLCAPIKFSTLHLYWVFPTFHHHHKQTLIIENAILCCWDSPHCQKHLWVHGSLVAKTSVESRFFGVVVGGGELSYVTGTKLL
jgi:hypothetical protein